MSSSPAVAAASTQACAEAAASETEALALAASCGRAIEVMARRAEDSQVMARPDGMLEWRESVVPRWARRADGLWADVDTTLRVVDGRVVPGNTTVSMWFSAGGAGAFATLSREQMELSMSWPGVLPAPVLEANTATYRDVLPDVDLKVTVEPSGFSEVLVVKTAAAAAHPNIRTVRFGYTGRGVSVVEAAGGGLEARDVHGSVVFRSPQAVMWDSHGAAGSSAGSRTAATPGSEPTAVPRVAVMAEDVDATHITVVPDVSMLTDAATVFPVFVDPQWSGGIRNNIWKLVGERADLKDSSTWSLNDGATKGDAGAGRTCDSSCYSVRSIFRMDLTGGYWGTLISAKFNIRQKWASTCNTRSNAKVWGTTGITSSTTWNTQPYWNPNLVAESDGNRRIDSAYGCAGEGVAEFDVTHIARNEIGNQAPEVNLGLRAIDESTMDQWKRFDHATAQLVLVYNNSPNPPAAQAFTTNDCYKACASATAASTTTTTQGQGWWKLNETSGTTAADAASPPHNLTKGGSGSIGWGDSRAWFYADSYLQASGPVLDTSKSFTVSAWVWLFGNGGKDTYRTAVSQDGASGSGFHLRYDWGHDRWAFVRQAADAVDPTGAYALSTAPPTTDTWVHLAGVYVNDSKEKSAALYVNGVLQSRIWANPVFNATGSLVVGRAKWQGGVSDLFNGAIDDVQAYQRPLDGTAVSTLYNAGRAGGALNINPATVRTTTPQVSFRVSDPDANAQLWSDVEIRTAPTETSTVVHTVGGLGQHASGAVVADTVPSGKLANGNTYYWRSRSKDELGWYGHWSAFHAVKVDTAPPAWGSPPVSSTQYPVKQWVSVVGTAGTFTLRASADTAEFEWWIDGGAVSIVNAVNGVATVSHTPSKDGPHTLTVKAKDIAGNVTATEHTHQFWVVPLPNRCWNWRLDEASGSTAADMGNTDDNDVICARIGSTVHAANATVSGAAVFGTGHVGNGLVLSGPGGGQAVTSGAVLDTSKSFTVMAWVKLTLGGSDPVVQTVLSQAGQNVSGFQLQYRKDANGGQGGLCMSRRASDATAAALAVACASRVPQADVWTHVAGVYDEEADQIRVYVGGYPGECNGFAADLSYTTPWVAGGRFILGRAGTDTAGVEPWIGGIDDVYAFQRVLEPIEICSRSRL